MFEAAQSCVLDGRFVRILRINLNDPAKPVVLIRVVRIGQIEAVIKHMPAVTETICGETVTRLLLVQRLKVRVVGAKVTVEVFFTGQVSTPRGDTAATVVHRAKRCIAGRILQEFRARNGSVELNRRVHCNPAVAVVEFHIPLVSLTSDTNNGTAMTRLREAHVIQAFRERLP